MMRGEPDRSGSEGLGARGVNDKVVWGEGARARGGAGAREVGQLGAHPRSVSRLVGRVGPLGPGDRLLVHHPR
jgi:hypothetical protein